jgi:nicotinamide-nucleotide amidase
MQAEIITIGDEILIGQVVDTNSAWLATRLNLAGISVKQITSVSDNREHILEALALAERRAQLVLLTGGLGPTNDDITKRTLCEYFNTGLVVDDATLKFVTNLFLSRSKPLLEVNLKQAEVLEGCTVLPNANGTAPGMWIEKGDKVFISMPGVPKEMKGIFSEHALPRLRSHFELPFICHRTILTQGLGESFLAQLIAGWEEQLAPKGIRLAYLPAGGKVRLRLSAEGKNKTELEALVDREVRELYRLAKDYIYGEESYGEAPPTQEPL